MHGELGLFSACARLPTLNPLSFWLENTITVMARRLPRYASGSRWTRLRGIILGVNSDSASPTRAWHVLGAEGGGGSLRVLWRGCLAEADQLPSMRAVEAWPLKPGYLDHPGQIERHGLVDA